MSSRYVKIGEETGTYGSGNPVAQTEGVLVTSVSDPIDRGPIIEECISGYIANNAFGGALAIKGTLEGSLRPKMMKPLFKAMMGTEAVVGSTTTYTLGLPKSLVMEIGEQTTQSDSMQTKYSGVGISGCTLNFNPKEIITVSYDWIAKNFTNGAFNAPLSYDSEDPVVFYNAVISIDSTPVTTIKSMTLSIDRKLDEEQYTLGAFDLQRLIINGMTEITGDLTFSEVAYAEYKKAMTGSGASTTIASNNPLGTANIIITCTDMKASPNTTMLIKMPVTVYTDTDRTISGMDEIEKRVNYRAVGSGFAIDVMD